MQPLIKALTLTVVTLGLTACGGSSGGSKSSVSSTSSSVTSSSSSSISLSSSLSSSSLSSSLTSSSSISSSSISNSSSSLASSSSAPTESTLSATSYTGFSVAEIKDCGLNISKPANAFPIFADYNTDSQNQALGSGFSGWNHVTATSPQWTNTKYPIIVYAFNNTAAVNESCNSVDTLNIVLLKKIADWDRQHANGFEKTITSDGKKFGDVENLVIDLKINSDKTSIPTVTHLKDIYVPTYVNEATVDALDAGKVNIGITIYDGKNETVLSASRIIELDQTALADKWIRVTIPMNDLKFCSTINYNCTSKTLTDLNNTVIAGIQFVAETKSGAVLRNSISTWSSTTPETFKEVDLSFKKIEFQLK